MTKDIFLPAFFTIDNINMYTIMIKDRRVQNELLNTAAGMHNIPD